MFIFRAKTSMRLLKFVVSPTYASFTVKHLKDLRSVEGEIHHFLQGTARTFKALPCACSLTFDMECA